MSQYTIVTSTEQDEVMQWGADKRGVTIQELVQLTFGKLIAERAGHFNDKREVLKRLDPQEIARIPQDLRDKLGL